MKLRMGIFLAFVSSMVMADPGATLHVLPLSGIPDGNSVVSFDVLETESQNRLVVEARDSTGMAVFYTFDYVNDELRARPAGTQSLPVQFLEPTSAVPEDAQLDGVPDSQRFWRVGGGASTASPWQYVTALSLAERRFADVTAAPGPELPPSSAGLAIEYLTADSNGTVLTRCVLESNLIRRSERMTATSATWITARGEPYLLVGMTSDAGAQPWPLFFRLYSPAMELVYQTGPVLTVDPNRFPLPIGADLNGDGEDEIVIFGTAGVGAPLVVLHPAAAAASGHRLLAMNECSVRMHGDDVIQLQRELERRGFSVGQHGIDGWYGPDTRGAVVRYQRSSGLLVTGVVDEATWESLGLR